MSKKTPTKTKQKEQNLYWVIGVLLALIVGLCFFLWQSTQRQNVESDAATNYCARAGYRCGVVRPAGYTSVGLSCGNNRLRCYKKAVPTPVKRVPTPIR